MKALRNLSLRKIRKERLGKLQRIRDLDIDPFPAKFSDRIVIGEARQQELDTAVRVAGRITAWREHGGLVFADLTDESGKIQLALRRDAIQLLPLLDIGDFLGVEGKLFKTKTSELTIEVANAVLLSKSIRPLPIKSGLVDQEERYRRRYVDLLINPEVKDLFRKKATFWQSMREFLVEKGFLEVETPVLETTVGGADAQPFTTHHNDLDIDVYLRISMGELWQKRLLVGGFEKVFEIGRQFRNEGMSREHLQDYTQMEFYWAYADYQDAMKLVEEMYKYVVQKTFGTLQFTLGHFEIDLDQEWKELDYVEAIENETGVNVLEVDKEDVVAKLKELKVDFNPTLSAGRLIDTLWKQVRGQLAGPFFVTGQPVGVSPLAKRLSGDPRRVGRFFPVIAGSELGNGYSELNDPIDQEGRFVEQQQLREAGDEEAQMHDQDFVEALEYGMPPAAGFGVSERLFAILADKPIRECVLFPLMKPITFPVPVPDPGSG